MSSNKGGAKDLCREIPSEKGREEHGGAWRRPTESDLMQLGRRLWAEGQIRSLDDPNAVSSADVAAFEETEEQVRPNTQSSTSKVSIHDEPEPAFWRVSYALDGLQELLLRAEAGEGDLHEVGCENLACLVEIINISLKQAVKHAEIAEL